MGELKGRRSLENGAQASRKPREDQQRGNSQRNLGKLELLPPPRLSPVAAGGEDEGPTLCPAPRGLALKRSLSPRFRARSLEPAHSPDLADPFPVAGGQCACWARPLGPRAPTAGGTQAMQPVPLWPCAPVTTAGGGPPCAPESPESPVRSRRACTAWSAGRGAHEWAAVAGPGCAGSLPRLSQALLRPATAAPISAALTGLCSCSLSSPWEANLRKRASAVRSLSPWFLFWTGLGAAEQGELPRRCASRFLVAFCRETFNHTEFSL